MMVARSTMGTNCKGHPACRCGVHEEDSSRADPGVAREIGAQAPPSRRATLLGAKTAVDRPIQPQTPSGTSKNCGKINSFFRSNSLN